MIVLFTDFGLHGPYLGQVRAVLHQRAPAQHVIDLISDAPAFNPKASAYLLSAYSRHFPAGTVFLAVVDPGVGSPTRMAAIVRAAGKWYVGPDNGLFNVLASEATDIAAWHVDWQPADASASFHGRDIFAPLAADLACGKMPPDERLQEFHLTPWSSDLAEVIYIDHFGNLITGIQAGSMPVGAVLAMCGKQLLHARTFSDVEPGTAMFYENANGLIEIAVNQGRADTYFEATIGTPVVIVQASE